MAETLPTGALQAATQVARDTPVRQSPNGVRFATFGETGVADLDLDRILEAVPSAIAAALGANTYYFVPLALRENAETPGGAAGKKPAPAMVASAWTDELSSDAICHRNVELGSGKRGIFISTRLLSDRFALSFEFFINVAHAFVDQAGVPAGFSELAWQQALDNVRGETSMDAWESRNLATGRPANAQPDEPPTRRPRSGSSGSWSSNNGSSSNGAPASRSFTAAATARTSDVDEKEKSAFLAAAFTDAIAMYLLSLALDFDYSELREREYPLLAPHALAARLRAVAELFPPNPGYEFAVRYRRRA